MKTHTETAFEKPIVEHLVLHGGYEPRGLAAYDPGQALASKIDYDIQRAVIPSDLFAFIEATQPKPWAKLRALHGAKLEDLFLNELCKVMDKRGALQVLRHGFKFYGQAIRPVVFAPGHGLNPEIQALYDANRVRVVRQLRYDPHNDKELDLAIFINALPIATAELKNAMTGQKAGHAKQQYRRDRDPKAPILRFKQRALVHFAVDADEVWMTTQLRGSSTWFLPFNRGDRHGAGNPAVAGRHRTCYLWEDVWQRDSLLDLVGRFVHLQKETRTNPNTGKNTTRETLIFPRFHQMDCVRRLLDASRKQGAGTNYLVQHSAGSGKSNSIACLVAFSGEVQDEDAPGVSYSETQMNGGIGEKELPEKFASDGYQLLIVANKYQTGFDQPLLCAMYVDKKLSGIQAVQTLSRLNRMHAGKEQTLVLDFVNECEQILDSFQDYYEVTGTDDSIDPQRLYELQHALDDAQLYTTSEVDGFAAVFFKLASDKSLADNPKLNAWLDPVVDRFKALKSSAGDEDGAAKQEEFRGQLSAFKNLYGFLASRYSTNASAPNSARTTWSMR